MTRDMPLQEAMTTQRAIRRLKPDPVEDDVLLRCIEMALKAPTGSNAQNWEWIVVRDPEVKAKLARFNRQAWRLYGGLWRVLPCPAENNRTILKTGPCDARECDPDPPPSRPWPPAPPSTPS